jgi:acyl carrier protein
MSISGSMSCGVLPSREQVLREVREIVAESSGMVPETLREDQLLRELSWDSLDQTECAMEIEEHFDISVPDELIDQAKTVGGVADGVLALLAQSPRGS